MNEAGKVDPQYLPGFTNNVVAVYVDPETGKGYYDEAHEKEYTDFDEDSIYTDIGGTGSYKWIGGKLTLMPDTSHMVEITSEVVQELWDSIDETGLDATTLLDRLDASLAAQE